MTTRQKQRLISRLVTAATVISFIVIFAFAAVWAYGLRIDFQERTVEQTAIITISDYGQETEVRLNNELVGIGLPRQIRGLNPGLYHLNLSRAGFESINKKIDLDVGEVVFIENIPLLATNFQVQPLSPNEAPRFITNNQIDLGLQITNGELIDGERLVARFTASPTVFKRFSGGYIYQLGREVRVLFPDYNIDRLIFTAATDQPVDSITEGARWSLIIRDTIQVVRLNLTTPNAVAADSQP